jgi:hypothetical protein
MSELYAVWFICLVDKIGHSHLVVNSLEQFLELALRRFPIIRFLRLFDLRGLSWNGDSLVRLLHLNPL